MTTSEQFARRQRLARSEDIRRVLSRGRRHRTANLEIAWIANAAGHPRLGLIVPKFQSNAVARNRLRRQLKEMWRREGLPRLGPIDIVVRTRPATYAARSSDLQHELLGWLDTKAPAP